MYEVLVFFLVIRTLHFAGWISINNFCLLNEVTHGHILVSQMFIGPTKYVLERLTGVLSHESANKAMGPLAVIEVMSSYQEPMLDESTWDWLTFLLYVLQGFRDLPTMPICNTLENEDGHA